MWPKPLSSVDLRAIPLHFESQSAKANLQGIESLIISDFNVSKTSNGNIFAENDDVTVLLMCEVPNIAIFTAASPYSATNRSIATDIKSKIK